MNGEWLLVVDGRLGRTCVQEHDSWPSGHLVIWSLLADLLRVPILGRLLGGAARARSSDRASSDRGRRRPAGCSGPQIAPTNMATVLTWCIIAAYSSCPAGRRQPVLHRLSLHPRDAGRRLHAPRLRWPRRFRTKWFGVALFAAVLTPTNYSTCRLPEPPPLVLVFLARPGHRRHLLRRGVLQVSLSDRAVQLRGFPHDVATRVAGASARDVPDVPDGRLHQGPPPARGAASSRTRL